MNNYEIYDMYDALVEVFDKNGYWRLYKIPCVIFSEYDTDNQERIIRCYSEKTKKILIYKLSWGKIIDFNYRLTRLVHYKNGDIKITQPKNNPHVLQNRFRRKINTIDYTKYKKWKGGYNWLMIEHSPVKPFGVYQIESQTHGLKIVKSCIQAVKKKGLDFLKLNMSKVAQKM